VSDLILANIIAEKVRETPDLDVLTFVTLDKYAGYQDEIRTYRQLWDKGHQFAAALQDASLAKGETFGLMMLNHPEFVDVMVGASITNTVFVPIDARTKGSKLSYMLDYAECKGIIVADYALGQLRDVYHELKLLQWVWVLNTGHGEELDNSREQWLNEILKEDFPKVEVVAQDPMDPMQMMYTSGTTGDPKAILTPHARFGGAAGFGNVFGVEAGDRPYTGLSLTHANAQLMTLAVSLKEGLRAVFSRKFTKSNLWNICRDYNCTTFTLLGGMTLALFAEPTKDNDSDNPVRLIISSGMPEAISEKFAQRFDVQIFEAYGTAEGGLTFNPPGVGPAGSIGKAAPHLICKILNENDEECLPGECGQICFQNADGSVPQVAYFKNPKASKEKMTGGWFRSGDIGHTDENGWLYFDYRDGGGIRRNGDFINPTYVEQALSSNSHIDDIFVYGISTEANSPGEKEVVAAIVLTKPEPDAIKAIFDHSRTKLEANFVPSIIQIVEEIPKTASEKPQERFLIEDLEKRGSNIYQR